MNVQRIAAFGSIGAVVAAVAAGLFVVGSPAEQRLLRFDEQRIFGLRQMSQAAGSRWAQEQRLPDSAADLVDGVYLSRLPRDPSSDEPHEYRVTGPRQYEVCAVFDRPSRPDLSGDFWSHEAGRRCFTFTVTERER
jgi:hypothetical protein